MPDIAYAGAALAAITQAIDSAKTLKELGKRIDNAEILTQVADLTLSLAEIKIQLAQALEDNAELRQEIAKENGASVFKHWLYLQSDPEPRCPICPICHANDKVIRMRQHTSDADGQVHNWFDCPEGHKGYRFFIAPEDAEELFGLLGGKGCYNPGPAKSSKPPPRRPPRNGVQLL